MEGKHIAGTAISTVIKVVIAAVIIMYVYRFSITAYDYGYRIFGETPVAEAPGENVTVAILENTSTKEVGRMLEQKGLIRDAGLFFWQEKVSSFSGEIKPGAYELNTSMTVEEMMEIMASGSATVPPDIQGGGAQGDTQEPETAQEEETEPQEESQP